MLAAVVHRSASCRELGDDLHGPFAPWVRHGEAGLGQQLYVHLLLQHLQPGSRSGQAQLWKHPDKWLILQRVQNVHSGLPMAWPRQDLIPSACPSPSQTPCSRCTHHPPTSHSPIGQVGFPPSPGSTDPLVSASLCMFLLCKLALNVLGGRRRNYISVHCQNGLTHSWYAVN